MDLFIFVDAPVLLTVAYKQVSEITWPSYLSRLSEPWLLVLVFHLVC